MPALPPRRRIWPRRLRLFALVLAGCALLIGVGVWLALPWLVTRAFHAAAESLGAEEATIDVHRADLTGLRFGAMQVRLGGLSAGAARAEVDYALTGLLAGRVSRLAVDGLEIALDFTRPRRGTLPDAVTDLVARFSGEGELVWPLDRMEITRSRLVLTVPGGARVFHLSGTATRQEDGRIAMAFGLHDGGEQHLTARAVLRTETMDGEFTIERLSLGPAEMLALLGEIGVAAMPEEMSLESDRIELSGTATLRDGAPVAAAASLEAPRLGLRTGPAAIRVAGLRVRVDQPEGGARDVTLDAHIEASDTAGAWRVEPARLHLRLEGHSCRGSLEQARVDAEAARATVSCTFAAGIPALGGPADAHLELTLDDLMAGGLAWAPISLRAAGWTESVQITIPRLASPDLPLEVVAFSATVQEPAADSRRVRAEAGLVITPTLAKHLPQAIQLSGWELPAQVAGLTLEVAPGSDSSAATLSVRSSVPRLRVTAAGQTWAALPELGLDLRATPAAASLEAVARLGDIATPFAGPLAQARSLSLRVRVPDTPLAALRGLTATSDEPADVHPWSASLAGELDGLGMRARSDLSLDRGADATWAARGNVQLESIDGAFGAVAVTNGSGSLEFRSGAMRREDLRALLASETLSWSDLARDIIAPASLRASLRAAAATVPGATLEWLDLGLEKPVADAGGAPLDATLSVRAGILRMPPETLEQPTLTLRMHGAPQALDATAHLEARWEGAPLVLDAAQQFTADDSGDVRSSGTFTLHPVALTYSDILARWVPAMKGSAFSGRLAIDGTTAGGSGRAWDGTARLTFADGVLTLPDQNLRLDGVHAGVELESIAALRTAPTQRIGFSRLELNDIVVSDAEVRFRTASSTVVHVEGAGFRVFDGSVTAEPFSLYFPDADVALDLRMKDLDAGMLVRTFDLFNGTLSGRLQGRLPIGLLAGKPILGEGFLELQPGQPAQLSFDAAGLFTSGMPNASVLEKVNRLPHELLEEALANLELRHFRIDLFRRDRPDRPIEAVLGGVARTPRAEVPVELAVRLNGSVSEVIDFLVQLILL